VRFAAAKTVKEDGDEVPSTMANVIDTLALPDGLLPAVADARPICDAAIEELRWEGEDGRYELTLTLWRYAGDVIAAEVSFKGRPDDLPVAQRLQGALRASHILEPVTKSKMDIVYALCLGEK